MLQLVKPELKYKEAHLDLLQEWEELELVETEVVPMSIALGDRTFERWLADTLRGETQPPEGFVPASTYYLVESERQPLRILGAINIRHTLNDYLLAVGGHIGYSIRPLERRRGLAKKQLALALPIAKQLGIDRALITCGKTNVGSARTILANGGVLENEVEDGTAIVQRYWVDIP